MIESVLALRLPILVLAIFAILIVSSEIGFWTGHWAARLYHRNKPREEVAPFDENVSTITNSSLGLLALFLGFTFSSAMTHFEQNRQAVITEAAAISSAYQYAKLQPAPFNTVLTRQIRDYVDVRLSLDQAPPTNQGIRDIQAKSSIAAQVIWQTIEEMSNSRPENALTQNLAGAVNEMSTAQIMASEYLISGVPTGLFAPVGVFVIFNAVLLGMSLGEGRKRHLMLSWGLYFLVALVVGIIVDLDRPLAGLINVDRQAMHIVRSTP